MDGINFSTAISNVLNNDSSVSESKAINAAILTGEGIDQIIEGIAEEHPDLAKALKNNKNTLKKLDAETQKLMEKNLNLPADIANKLGINQNATINEVFNAAFSKISQQANAQTTGKADTTSETSGKNNFFGLQNLTSEVIDLMCILLCQESKSQLVETLKEVLKQKVSARQELSSEHLQKTQNALIEQVEAQNKAAEAKKASIIKSVFSMLTAFITAAVAVGITVASAGTGAVAAAMLMAGAISSCVSAAVSTAASICSIIAVTTTDTDAKDKLNKVALGLGIAAAFIGLVAGISNTAGAAKSGVTALTKAIEIAGEVASGLATIAEGATEIYSGVLNIQAAKIQKELANLKIDITKLDQEIATLAAFIETITQDIQKFIEDILNCEQEAVEALHARTDTEQKISQQIA